jgi:magnesium transporter
MNNEVEVTNEVTENSMDELKELKEPVITKRDYAGEIICIVRSNESLAAMQSRLEDYHENDIADALPQLTQEERIRLYSVLDIAMLSAIFEYATGDEASLYLSELDAHKAADIISELDSDTAVDVLRSLPKDRRTQLLELMDDESRRDVRLISSFDEDEIGSKMTTNYIVISNSLSIKEAMSSLVKQAADNDNISTLFVVDNASRFYGAIDLKELIIARKSCKLEDLIVTSFPYVYGHESVDDCIEKLKDYSENSIPVLDNNNRILGVITSQSLIEVVDDEMGEDYAMLAGLTAEEDLSEPLKDSIKKRLPWLLVLLGLGLVVSSVVGMFENVVSQLTLIMAFQSLILDMAGNVGTQSLAVTIRVLMDESLTTRNKLKLVLKEGRISLCNGIVLGVLSFVCIGLYIYLFKHKTLGFAYAVSGCIGVSLIVAMLVSGVVGTLIPLFFKKIKIDPAVASGPLITTVNDLVAVITYYGISWLLLLEVLKLA